MGKFFDGLFPPRTHPPPCCCVEPYTESPRPDHKTNETDQTCDTLGAVISLPKPIPRGRCVCTYVCVCAQIPDVAATATAAYESADSRPSTPDELTPALPSTQPVGGGCCTVADDDAAAATAAVTTYPMTAADTKRSTSFGEYLPLAT